MVLHVNVIIKTTLFSLFLPSPIIRSFSQAFAVNLDIILTNDKARLNPFLARRSPGARVPINYYYCSRT